MILRRNVDKRLEDIANNAPEEYDTLVEIADEINNMLAKLDKITVTQNINLDELQNPGTIQDFENSFLG